MNRFSYLSIIVFAAVLLNNIQAAVPDDVWKLPEGQYIPAKMSMHLVYPRPDSETSIHARHKFAYPSLRYEIPIGVQGGAWPFKYEIVSAPAGATVGSIPRTDNYGIVTWEAANSGSQTFELLVTDQELNTLTVKWNVQVTPDKFTFIQDAYSGDKRGTLEQPLEDISDWYKHDELDATFADQILVFRSGNYTLVGDPDRNNNVRLNTGIKTRSFINYPDEEPVIDSSQAKIFTDTSEMTDLFFSGLRFENGRQDVNNAHFIWAIGDVTRSTWWNNQFHQLGPGSIGNDNTGTVFISNTSILKENILFKGNLLTEIRNSGFNGHYFEAYVSSYVLIESNVVKYSDSGAGFYAKGTRAFVTIRDNESVIEVSGSALGIGGGAEARDIPHHHEICWNNARVNDNSTILKAFHNNSYQGQTYATHIYRNTLTGGSSWVRFRGREDFFVDGNVVTATHIPARWNTDIMSSLVEPNLFSDGSETFVDTNNQLIEPYRTMYFGRRGHALGLNLGNMIFSDGFETLK